MIHLTPEQIDARRVEYAQIEEQIRVLGRRKSILKGEILSGYAAPAKGVPAEQLSLDTSTATDRDGKPLDTTLFKPSKHPEHLLPTLTSKGKRAVLALLKSAPGGRMPLREITARLGLPDALPLPSECYYQSGDWVLKETPKVPKKAAAKPAPKTTKPAAKKPARAPKKATKAAPLPALGDRIDRALRTWGSWYDEGQLQAAIREGEPLGQQHSDRDWRGVLKDMLRSKRIERREEGGRVQFRLAPLPKVKKPAPEAPRPTVTVGEAVSKLLAETPPQRWQKVRSLVADRLAGNRGYSIPVAGLYLSVDHGSEIDAVMELLEEAGATRRHLSTVGHQRMIEAGAAVDEDGEKSIQEQMLALTHAYMLELVVAHLGHPTTDDLASWLELPRGLVLSVLDELRESGALTRGNGGRWQAAKKAPAPRLPAPSADDIEAAVLAALKGQTAPRLLADLNKDATAGLEAGGFQAPLWGELTEVVGALVDLGKIVLVKGAFADTYEIATAQARTLPLIPGVDPAPASEEPCPT